MMGCGVNVNPIAADTPGHHTLSLSWWIGIWEASWADSLAMMCRRHHGVAIGFLECLKHGVGPPSLDAFFPLDLGLWRTGWQHEASSGPRVLVSRGFHATQGMEFDSSV